MTPAGALLYTTLDSPLGELLLLGDGSSLRGLYMQQGRKPATVASGWRREPGAFAAVGETLGYGELARRIERPAAARAVGAANGANPLSVVIPCHRLVGASGALTGYGGGVERKRLLLELEARTRG